MRLANWGFKDPRTVLALDVWRSMFPRPRVVLVTRDYPDVVQSASRNFFAPSEPEVDAILQRYVRNLERMLGNKAVVTLRYEEVFGSSHAGSLQAAVMTLGLTFDESSLALIGRPTGNA